MNMFTEVPIVEIVAGFIAHVHVYICTIGHTLLFYILQALSNPPGQGRYCIFPCNTADSTQPR